MNYFHTRDVDQRGRIHRIEYTVANHFGQPNHKYVNVYLPYGYDATDSKTRYNILYLMHGGGGNPDAWLDSCRIKNVLDYVISEGIAKPLIVAFPSYYNGLDKKNRKPGSNGEREEIYLFQTELAEAVIPAVESQVKTFAEDTSREALKKSRMHRGFGGFSMGGGTTWNALLCNLDYFSHFLPLSGDCWAIEPMGGASKPVETVDAICKVIYDSGYKSDEYKIYAATGTKDIAYKALNAQVAEMRTRKALFIEGKDFTSGNFHYLLAEGEYHTYEAVCQYVYQFLPYLF